MLLICQSSGWKKINLEHGRVGNLVKTPRVESSLKFYELRAFLTTRMTFCKVRG